MPIDVLKTHLVPHAMIERVGTQDATIYIGYEAKPNHDINVGRILSELEKIGWHGVHNPKFGTTNKVGTFFITKQPEEKIVKGIQQLVSE